MELATFGAGCFWGVEAAFAELDGVTKTTVGYTGGTTANPTYKQVCTGQTGHAEVTQVEFDPARISYDQLLDAFWRMHNPTTLNRQGPDFGTQYRSVIYYHNDSQQQLAEKSRADLDASGKLGRSIVTAIEPAGPFYPAEDYHQQYLAKRGERSCHL